MMYLLGWAILKPVTLWISFAMWEDSSAEFVALIDARMPWMTYLDHLLLAYMFVA